VLALPLGLLPALADARVEQLSKVEFGGFLGSMFRTFGGKAAREGVTSLDALKGERLMSRTMDTGELIDLAAEKVYTVQFDKKKYSVKTFAQIREEMKKALEDAKKQQAGQAQAPPPEQAEYEWTVDLKETGKTEKISGWDTRQVVTTVTGYPKGKTLETGGGIVVTLDSWLGPQLKELDEQAAFRMRYFQAIGLFETFGAEMQQMAMLLATNPQFAEAMKKLQDKRVDLSGSAIRTKMTFDSVASPEQQKAQASEEQESTPTSVGGLLGGLGKKMMKKKEAPAAGAAPGRTTMFTSTTTIVSAGSSVPDAEVTIPADCKEKS
jgi:hypothetical protein